MSLTRRAFLQGTGCLFSAAGGATAAARHQRPSFRIEALPLLRGCEHSRVTSINNTGQVVGMCSAESFAAPNAVPTTRAILWQHGKVIEILNKQLPSLQPLFINNRGEVLLSGPYGGGEPGKRTPEYRVLWNGKSQKIWHEEDGFLPDAMNNLGEMAGRTNGGSRVAFHKRDGKLVPINVPNMGGFAAHAHCINDAGQVSGTFYNDVTHISPSLFMWQDGKLGTVLADTAFGAVGSRTSYYPGAMNEKGQVAGTYHQVGGTGRSVAHLFVWESAGIVDKGVLGNQGMAHGINNKEMIVGEGDWPFLMTNGEVLNLNDLLPEDTGWSLSEAAGINDRVQIAGNGTLHGKDRAFLLTPGA